MEEKIYKKGYVYKITSPHTDKVYIGSTTQKLYKRFSSHKNKYNRYLEKKHQYVSVFDILEAGDSQISAINQYENITLKNLQRKEGEITKKTINACNKAIAGRTNDEWRKDNEIILKEKKRKYNEEHIHERKEYDRKYHEENKSKIHARQAQHYQQKIKDKVKVVVEGSILCECGMTYTKQHKSRHSKTQVHQRRMQELQKQ